jgi:Tfp pilus assembly protein PilO
MRNLLLPTVLVIAAVFSFFWYSKPAYNEVRDLRSSIDEYDTALSRVAEIQDIRDQLLTRYSSLPGSSLYVLYKILPDEVSSVRFLIELDQVATKHGLTIQEPTYEGIDDEEGAGSYQPTKVNFSTAGSYEDVLDFIRDVERSARLIDIVEMSVAANSSSNDSTVQSGELNTYQFIVQIYSVDGLPQDR